ncbi:MAG: LysM peptidoglycan-binding domain-containing protein [Candidatus Gastranaerophilales bacterium]|nr:LysM peptidoglycan-binding domain-containing protein [Candidatus Gastranaerophilales bacterium]
MRNSSIYRSNLSDEKIAFLSELKNQREFEKEDISPKTYKRLGKQKELDLLWQNFKISPKEEKSPGIYLLTGFIAGALCIFIMNSILSISSGISTENSTATLGQPKFEKKISRKSKLPQINSQVAVIPAAQNSANEISIPASENYIVKNGDSMSSIVYRFYGKYDLDKVEKIKQANNLTNAHKLSIGQKLVIPLD